jgi:hypothetical protein
MFDLKKATFLIFILLSFCIRFFCFLFSFPPLSFLVLVFPSSLPFFFSFQNSQITVKTETFMMWSFGLKFEN